MTHFNLHPAKGDEPSAKALADRWVPSTSFPPLRAVHDDRLERRLLSCLPTCLRVHIGVPSCLRHAKHVRRPAAGVV